MMYVGFRVPAGGTNFSPPTAAVTSALVALSRAARANGVSLLLRHDPSSILEMPHTARLAADANVCSQP